MKRFLYILVLATGFLAACTQVTKQPDLQTVAINNIDQIQWLTISPDIKKRWAPFNCAANEFNIPGQGYKSSGVGGADGGMTYDVSLTTDTSVTTASARGKGWQTMTSMLAPVQQDAMMLVIDDFRGDTQGNNGVYKPSPELFLQSELDVATLKLLQSQNKLSHGALVFQHAKDVIWGSGLYLSRAAPTPDTTVYYKNSVPSPISKKLTLKAINTQFASTGAIAGSITSKKISDILSPILVDTAGVVPPMTVINLSFALLPCEAYADFIATDKLASEDLTFQDYLTKLADFNNVTFDEIATTIVEATNDPNDPLFKLIQSASSGARKHIFVAASGNYGFRTTAMYPAKWKGVIDVTGSAANKTSLRHERFNTGEIMDVAASFLLRASRFTNNLNAKNVYYLGTSFSTPTVSVYSALDVASQKRCISSDPLAIRSKLAINSSDLIEAPLRDAVAILCAIR
jgi:Subtilase family